MLELLYPKKYHRKYVKMLIKMHWEQKIKPGTQGEKELEDYHFYYAQLLYLTARINASPILSYLLSKIYIGAYDLQSSRHFLTVFIENSKDLDEN